MISRPTTELCAGRLAEAGHGHFIDDGQRLAYQVPPAARAQQRFVMRQTPKPAEAGMCTTHGPCHPPASCSALNEGPMPKQRQPDDADSGAAAQLHECPLGSKSLRRRHRGPAGAGNSRGLNLETAALSGQHLIDGRCSTWGTGRISRRQRLRDADSQGCANIAKKIWQPRWRAADNPHRTQQPA